MIMQFLLLTLTLGSIYSTYASGAEQMTKKKFKSNIMGLRTPNGRRQTSWLFTSVVEDLNLALTREEIQLALRAGLEYSGPQKCKFSDLTTRPRCHSYNTTTK